MPFILRQVGRYEVLREIGRGGMAAVYLARQPDLDRLVALKELAPHYASDAAFATRFVAESRMAGSLSHPNIVTVYDFFEHDGVPYISMEYLERGSLRPWVGRLTLAQIAGVLEGLLSGLTHAESRGIVHRDLKPENVMVTSDGGVKITDFGIAKALNQVLTTRAFVTEPGMAIGTPMYMAPEQAMARDVGPGTDLYSAGVMAYELIVGQVPFPDADTPAAILVHQVSETPAPPRVVHPGLDAQLSDWIERLLRKDREERPASAEEAWYRLEEIIIHLLGARWRREARLEETPQGELRKPLTPAPFPTAEEDMPPPRPVERATEDRRRSPAPPTALAAGATVASEPAPTGAPPETAKLQTRRRRVRGVWLVAALALVVVAGVLGAMLLSGGGGTKADTATTTPTAIAAERAPSTTDQVSLAADGSSVYVASRAGRIVRLNGTTPHARVVDPAGPRGIAADRNAVYVVDGDTLTEFRPGSLAPVAAAAFPGASLLTGAAGSPIVAVQATGNGTSRLCPLSGVHVSDSACKPLPFQPTGLGEAPNRVFLADGRNGTVYTLPSATLALPEHGIKAGPNPHGRLVEFRRRLYVPVEGGVAVVDTTRGKLLRTVSLPGTPSDIWIDPASGVLFATMYAHDRVATFSTAKAHGPVRLTAVSSRPVAVVGSRSGVYVVSARGATVARLNPRTGALVGLTTISGAGTPALPVEVLAPQLVDGSRSVKATIRLTGGELGSDAVVSTDTAIADGHGEVALWQGGISTSSRAPRTAGGLSVRLRPAAGRLVVDLEASPSAFTRVTVARRGTDTILLTATKPAPEIPVQNTTPTYTTPRTTGTTTRTHTTPPPTTAHQTPTTTAKTTTNPVIR